jgi:hypothetical protein
MTVCSANSYQALKQTESAFLSHSELVASLQHDCFVTAAPPDVRRRLCPAGQPSSQLGLRPWFGRMRIWNSISGYVIETDGASTAASFAVVFGPLRSIFTAMAFVLKRYQFAHVFSPVVNIIASVLTAIAGDCCRTHDSKCSER